MKRQVIITDWKHGVPPTHGYEDKGPGRAVSRPDKALQQGRVVGTKSPGSPSGDDKPSYAPGWTR
jgi:hypothetical protein